MVSCGLYICDHPGTTNFEAIAYNWPTLMFWDPAISFFYDEIEPDYKMLRDAEILHDSPEAAAKLLNEINGDFDYWWKDKSRQAARAAFSAKYTRLSGRYIEDWSRELCVAAELPSRGRD